MSKETALQCYIDQVEKRMSELDKYIREKIADLEKYLHDKIDDLERMIMTRLDGFKAVFETRNDAEDKAKVIAAALLEARLETMNRFREQLKDQQNEFTTKVEHEALIAQMDIRYGALAKSLDEKYNRIMDDLKALQLSKSNLEGKASMSMVYIAYLFTAVGALGTLASILFGLIGIGLHFLK